MNIEGISGEDGKTFGTCVGRVIDVGSTSTVE